MTHPPFQHCRVLFFFSGLSGGWRYRLRRCYWERGAPQSGNATATLPRYRGNEHAGAGERREPRRLNIIPKRRDRRSGPPEMRPTVAELSYPLPRSGAVPSNDNAHDEK